jgi:methylphosphotriester-DNA--protein-cysteine methyltransferase
MLTETIQREYYEALLQKNRDYDGIFYVGVTTTGIFVVPHVLLENLKEHIVNFLKQLKKLF